MDVSSDHPPIVLQGGEPRLGERALRVLWHGSLAAALLWSVAIAALLLVGALLTYATGGTELSFLHVIYVPVGLAALRFGLRGGVVAGLLAGLMLGPYMPLDVAAGTTQAPAGWLFRTLLFVFNGALLGLVADTLRRRIERVEALRTQLGQVYARNLRLFATLVAERDEETAGHCERVAQNAVAIGRLLEVPKPRLKALYWSGLLHDLGKIGVPEAILRKPGRLDSEEYAVMRRHARLGYDVLIGVTETFDEIAQGVYAHHERFDGAGYPRRLRGEDIPLFGRIIAVVDVFEAVTSERPYRHPMPVEEALELIVAGSGSQFDPRVVGAFTLAYERGLITRQENPVPIYDSYVESVVAGRFRRVDQTLVE